MTLNEAQKAWLACAIDSEGCICTSKPKPGRNKPYPAMFVFNTNLKFVEHAALLAGDIARVHKAQSSKVFIVSGERTLTKFKPVYRLQVNGTKCISLLKEILPYLIIKKDAALRAIECNTSTRLGNIALINNRRKDKGEIRQ